MADWSGYARHLELVDTGLSGEPGDPEVLPCFAPMRVLLNGHDITSLLWGFRADIGSRTGPAVVTLASKPGVLRLAHTPAPAVYLDIPDGPSLQLLMPQRSTLAGCVREIPASRVNDLPQPVAQDALAYEVHLFVGALTCRPMNKQEQQEHAELRAHLQHAQAAHYPGQETTPRA